MRKLKKVNRHSRSVQQYAAGCVNCNSKCTCSNGTQSTDKTKSQQSALRLASQSRITETSVGEMF